MAVLNVLMLGKGKGSFEMRGQQLGGALGARVVTHPSADDWCWADLVVLLKRWTQYAGEAHQRNLPVVWDALDFWGQPFQNGVTEHVAKQMLLNQIKAIRPALVVGATAAMAAACGGVYLPHHSWDGLEPTPPGRSVKSVAYEGSERYLGAWEQPLRVACQKRGWEFFVNPTSLADADIIVALRGDPWDGWICREWKSGVKLVNAIAAGRPVITQQSAAWRELLPPGATVDSPRYLEEALGLFSSTASREGAYYECRALAPTYRIAAIADRYLGLLETARASCAV